MEFSIPNVLSRDIQVDLTPDFITTITGPRRSGKTYLCFFLMQKLIEAGVPRTNILYINFEDEKLLGAKADDMNTLLNMFYEITRIDEKSKVYLFLDEIQNVQNWDAWVRRVHDTEKTIKMILTGSSSKLLGRELATVLRGRVLNWEVYPLSFKEYLAWKHVTYDIRTLPQSTASIEIKRHFNEYLGTGGFPAIILNPEHHDTILQGYYDAMIFKDVVERHKIKEIKKLRLLASLLFEATAREITYSKLANKLKSTGIDISKNTIIDYISIFEEAYLFFQNLKYEYSTTQQLGAIKKIYCIDNGLLNAVSFKFSSDIGRLLENAVYVELHRSGKKIYHHKDKHDCDFVLHEKNEIVHAIQVTQTLTDENEHRELQGLLEAMAKHNLAEGTVVTHDQESSRTINGKTITVLPAWHWFLMQS